MLDSTSQSFGHDVNAFGESMPARLVRRRPASPARVMAMVRQTLSEITDPTPVEGDGDSPAVPRGLDLMERSCCLSQQDRQWFAAMILIGARGIAR